MPRDCAAPERTERRTARRRTSHTVMSLSRCHTVMSQSQCHTVMSQSHTVCHHGLIQYVITVSLQYVITVSYSMSQSQCHTVMSQSHTVMSQSYWLAQKKKARRTNTLSHARRSTAHNRCSATQPPLCNRSLSVSVFWLFRLVCSVLCCAVLCCATAAVLYAYTEAGAPVAVI